MLPAVQKLPGVQGDLKMFNTRLTVMHASCGCRCAERTRLLFVSLCSLQQQPHLCSRFSRCVCCTQQSFCKGISYCRASGQAHAASAAVAWQQQQQECSPAGCSSAPTAEGCTRWSSPKKWQQQWQAPQSHASKPCQSASTMPWRRCSTGRLSCCQH